MINKVFKTILILSLCLGISMPAYTAVSVSDGSAFVTKVEFDSDMNNLDNRMAVLENSLDAKIDSLVSAYLTRNGIWNGRKQELTTYNGLSNTPTNTQIFSLYKSGLKANMNVKVDGVADGCYKLVERTDKTGLAHVKIATYGTGIQIVTMNSSKWPFSGYTYQGSYFSDHRYMRDGVRYSGAVNLHLYVNTVQVYQDEVINCELAFDEFNKDTGIGLYEATWIAGWNDKELNAYFFVSKDDEIEWNMIYTAGYGEYWNNSNFSVEPIRGDDFGVELKEVTIY